MNHKDASAGTVPMSLGKPLDYGPDPAEIDSTIQTAQADGGQSVTEQPSPGPCPRQSSTAIAQSYLQRVTFKALDKTLNIPLPVMSTPLPSVCFGIYYPSRDILSSPCESPSSCVSLDRSSSAVFSDIFFPSRSWIRRNLSRQSEEATSYTRASPRALDSPINSVAPCFNLTADEVTPTKSAPQSPVSFSRDTQRSAACIVLTKCERVYVKKPKEEDEDDDDEEEDEGEEDVMADVEPGPSIEEQMRALGLPTSFGSDYVPVRPSVQKKTKPTQKTISA
eukprot:Selendium_serpulae@DN4930_c0_g1_i1.p1